MALDINPNLVLPEDRDFLASAEAEFAANPGSLMLAYVGLRQVAEQREQQVGPTNATAQFRTELIDTIKQVSRWFRDRRPPLGS